MRRLLKVLLVTAVVPFACKHRSALEDAGAAPSATPGEATVATATGTVTAPAATTAEALAPLGGSPTKLPVVRLPDGGMAVKLADGGLMAVPEGGLPALGIPPNFMPSALPTAFAVPSGMPTTFPSGIPTNLIPSAMPSGLKLLGWPPPAASK